MMNNVLGRRGLLRLGKKDEEPNARGSRSGGNGGGEAEVLAEHELEVVVGGEGD